MESRSVLPLRHAGVPGAGARQGCSGMQVDAGDARGCSEDAGGCWGCSGMLKGAEDAAGAVRGQPDPPLLRVIPCPRRKTGTSLEGRHLQPLAGRGFPLGLIKEKIPIRKKNSEREKIQPFFKNYYIKHLRCCMLSYSQFR